MPTEVILCPTCNAGTVRVRKGVETDEYRCVKGHTFLVEFGRGPGPQPEAEAEARPPEPPKMPHGPRSGTRRR